MKTKILILTTLALFLLAGAVDNGLAKEKKWMVRYGHTWGEEKPGGTQTVQKGGIVSQTLFVRVNLSTLPVFVWSGVPQVKVTQNRAVNQRNYSSNILAK